MRPRQRAISIYSFTRCAQAIRSSGSQPGRAALGPWVNSEPTSLASIAPYSVYAPLVLGAMLKGQCWSPLNWTPLVGPRVVGFKV